MNTKTAVRMAAATWSLIFAAGAWAGVSAGPQSRIWLRGDSTLHPYSSTATVVGVAFDPADGAPAGIKSEILSNKVKRFEFTVGVKDLKSGEKGLDKNMYAALKADQTPSIVFTMTGYTIEGTADKPAIAATGELSIAGTKKTVTLKGSLTFVGDKAIVEGTQPLLMTDYGIKPPVFMMGTLKTKNEILVGFHLEMGPASKDQNGGGK